MYRGCWRWRVFTEVVEIGAGRGCGGVVWERGSGVVFERGWGMRTECTWCWSTAQRLAGWISRVSG